MSATSTGYSRAPVVRFKQTYRQNVQ